MSEIGIRQDESGRQAVYLGEMLLARGLSADDAQHVATFFRATGRDVGSRTGREQRSGGRTGQTPLRGGRG